MTNHHAMFRHGCSAHIYYRSGHTLHSFASATPRYDTHATYLILLLTHRTERPVASVPAYRAHVYFFLPAALDSSALGFGGSPLE